MGFYVTINDLAWFLGFCLLMVIGCYLVVVLRNINKLLCSAHAMVEENRENIKNSAALLPELVTNLQETSSSIREVVQKTDETIICFEENILEAVDAIASGTDSLVSKLNILLEIIKALSSLSIFNKK